MNKSIAMTTNEFKSKIVGDCCYYGLSDVILDLIAQGVYLGVRQIAKK